MIQKTSGEQDYCQGFRPLPPTLVAGLNFCGSESTLKKEAGIGSN